MKISFFLDNSCQYDSRVLREAGALAAQGHSLTIYAFRADDTDFVEERDGFRIMRLTGIKPLRRFRAMQFFYSAYRLLLYYFHCWQILKDEYIDVYHCHDLLTLPIGCLLKKMNGGKLIYDSHELYIEQASLNPIMKFIGNQLEKKLIHHADRVITVNSFIAEELSRRYNIPLPSVILNCPSRTSEVYASSNSDLRQTLKIPDNIPIILYIGGYIAGRGLENLIVSANYFGQGIIIFMGYGAAEDKLKELVKARNLSNKIIFADPVSPDELVQYIQSASIGVVLFTKVDLNNYYGSPNKIFEYINAGLPVVCSDFPFMKTVVEGYSIGKTCNPDDPKSIADAINWVLEDTERYNTLKQNTQKAADMFNWERESQKLVVIYEGLELQIAKNKGKGNKCAV